MSSVDETNLVAQLVCEGFSRVYAWEDMPNARYPNHTHGVQTTHFILRGEMTLTMDGVSKTLREGERCDVPASAVHSARLGLNGCRYLIGERNG
jgi:glyoxylate utilization-related uncharacterized protein